jgi:ATP-binding cassette subfamily B protein RaxB
VENVAVIYLGARLAHDGALTVGMLFAFMSYKQHFIERAVQLVEKALEFRVLDLHLERLGDIALTPREPGHDRPPASLARPVAGRIELRNVSFRYAESEPFVLAGVDQRVEPG